MYSEEKFRVLYDYDIMFSICEIHLMIGIHFYYCGYFSTEIKHLLNSNI